jgi:McrBC 5-methylcytosine restriction system component
MIPISNLYYLLCYAWRRLDERDFVDIETNPFQDLPNLLARVLIGGVKRLLRQGFDREYVSCREDSQNPKGKIDIADSIKRALLFKTLLYAFSTSLVVIFYITGLSERHFIAWYGREKSTPAYRMSYIRLCANWKALN